MIEKLKPIATDIYSFDELVDGGYTYVDKTAILHRLVAGKLGKQFFVARPRRFGKSLAVSTLKCLFEGRRELFRGLAIDSTDYDWRKYPVIHLDMGSCQASTLEDFGEKVAFQLRRAAQANGVAPSTARSVDVQFAELCASVANASETRQVVLLVDEYDKPLLGHIGRPLVEDFRNALKSFYSVIKTLESLQRFTFITGVSKFSKVSIFSDLNNLVDLTLDARVATLFGYTHDEVLANFAPHLAALGKANGMTADEAFARVLEWYNGYCFEEHSPTVVNPVSLGRCLVGEKFKSFWYETGTPTFLVNELKKRPVDISELDVSDSALGTYEPSNPALVPLLFQTGYLTIKGAETMEMHTFYHLGFPNREVRDAFYGSLAPAYVAVDEITLGSAQFACARALRAHDLEKFFKNLKVFFANVPYDLTDRQNEQTWQVILYTVLRFIGVCIEAEVRTNEGRIDAVVRSENEIYVIEVKLDHPPTEALAQIRARHYADRYLADPRRKTLVGIDFSSERRTIADWQAEEL